MSTSILHLFFFTCFLLLKMHYLDHILECPIGPSLKVVQLRRLFDWTNMAAALHQFFGAARHPCFEVSALYTVYRDSKYCDRGGGKARFNVATPTYEARTRPLHVQHTYYRIIFKQNPFNIISRGVQRWTSTDFRLK